FLCQAKDGIRDFHVTGVQTCALPIYLVLVHNSELYLARHFQLPYHGGLLDDISTDALLLEIQRSLDYFERQMRQSPPQQLFLTEIGRASRRETVYIFVF